MKIGIIGSGVMASGIAQVFAQTEGFTVVIASERSANAKTRLAKGFAKRIEKGKMKQDAADAILARISNGLMADCADCDLIIESTVENLEVKKTKFKELQAIVRPDTLFATNTSSLSITAIGAGLDRPAIGMHFFNPAPVMNLVEIIAGLNTPTEMVEKVCAIAEQIGKTPVQVNEAPGFVVNRLLIPMINEAIGLINEGVSSPEEIDTAMKLGANHPMGPLTLGDLIGLDVVLAIMEVLQDETGDPKYRPSPLLVKMVRGGQLGVKSSQGFFTYAK